MADMRWLAELKGALNARDRYQWLGVRHQFSWLHHDRGRADEAVRAAHAEFDMAGVQEGEAAADDVELDLDSADTQETRQAAIQRERAWRQLVNDRIARRWVHGPNHRRNAST